MALAILASPEAPSIVMTFIYPMNSKARTSKQLFENPSRGELPLFTIALKFKRPAIFGEQVVRKILA